MMESEAQTRLKQARRRIAGQARRPWSDSADSGSCHWPCDVRLSNLLRLLSWLKAGFQSVRSICSSLARTGGGTGRPPKCINDTVSREGRATR